MRDLLTDRETAKILGKRIDRLYRIVDEFDDNPHDEWILEEGVHFEYSGPSAPGSSGKRPRRFSEEGIEAIARYLEANEKQGFLSWVRERLFQAKKKRKQLLVSRRITQEFLDAGGSIEIHGALAFVTRKSTVSILQTNHLGFNNSWERLRTAGVADGEESLEINKDFLEKDDRQLLLSQRGIAAVARACTATAASPNPEKPGLKPWARWWKAASTKRFAISPKDPIMPSNAQNRPQGTAAKQQASNLKHTNASN